MVGPLKRLLVLLLVVLTAGGAARGWEEKDKILLQEVQALTLYPSEITNSRRTIPIPQLHCVGGTAGCVANTPEVALCYNRGGDGNDVQWECKVELDNSYRFGKAVLSCEGYDSPDDPYILKGSCGLQYTLDLTKEGQKTFGNGSNSTTFGPETILIILFGVLAYGIYRVCCCNHWPHHQRRPPPPGFNSGTAGISRYNSDSVPGFWTGLLDGWLLGYLVSPLRSPTFYSRSPFFNTWTSPSAPPSAFSSSSGFTTPSTPSSKSTSDETKSTSGQSLLHN
ncbi:store-operated calcium entry-associated regulatory factor-like isoform X2 [Tiliqua scincoides]|uniref:store-operated calcium entry-associated regulatory factor-like isoform X2 n=1 Tax=Tiliqua scincoides TaxID=71010 RepID=UPI0034617C2E